MKLKYIKLCGFTVAIICLIFASCEQDNYSLPQGGIKGVILDSNNERVQTEQPNGIKIRLIEEKYGDGVTPIDFWSKADGTFENNFVFEGKYKVIPIEGPFFPIDTAEVDINGMTTIDFEVTPFLTIDASANVTGGDVMLSYTISRNKIGGKITTVKILASSYPSVSNTINEKNITHNFSDIDDAKILEKNYTDTITNLSAGTYYVRVAAMAANSYNKYNYSEVFTVLVP